MALRAGINGLGRIGRNILRAALADKEFDIVAVNDITDAETLGHLLRYDSILGNLTHEVSLYESVVEVRWLRAGIGATVDPCPPRPSHRRRLFSA